MKKSLLVCLSSLMVLSSCGLNSFAKEIASEDEFVTISKNGDSNFNVVKANRVFKKSDTGTDTSLSSANHNAEIYSGDDFVYEVSTKMTGFTIKYDVDTYFLIEGDKNGIVSEDASILTEYRNLTRTLIDTDYDDVLKAYANMKNFIGKSGNAEVGGISYTNVSLTFADANTTLGYTLKYTYENNGGLRSEDHYITLDSIGDSWGISYYSRRITDVIDGTEFYYVTEYEFSCKNDADFNKSVLNAKNNVSSYSFTAKGIKIDAVELEDGNSLSKK